jgi:hypothetical protein
LPFIFTVALAGPQNVRAETPLIFLTPGTHAAALRGEPEATAVAASAVAVPGSVNAAAISAVAVARASDVRFEMTIAVVISVLPLSLTYVSLALWSEAVERGRAPRREIE